MAQKSTEAELQEAWYAWYNNPRNKQNADKLYTVAKPILSRIINAYLGAQTAQDPLIMGRAKRILFDSLSKYDPSKGPIVSYLWTNMQRIQRVSNIQQNVIRLSEKDALAARDFEQTVKRLTDELGREPTDEEIADDMGISIGRIAKLRRRKFGFESAFEAATEEGYGTLPSAISLGTAGIASEKQLAKTLYDATEDKIDKFIIERLYGLHGRQVESPAEIAAKLNVSRSAVSQRIKRINDDLVNIRSAFTSK